MKQIQLHLFKEIVDRSHGGSKAKGKRKSFRPLSTKDPIHLVLKAKEPFQLLRNIDTVEQTLKKYALRFGITIYETAVQADHLHLSIKIPSRDLYCRWIRAITSVLTIKISALKWSLPPYTRIATWGRDFNRLKKYIQANKIVGAFLIKAHSYADQYLAKALSVVCADLELL